MADPTQADIDAFVRAAHGQLDVVRDSLAAQPALLTGNATWIETPLGAAAHVGNVAIARHLLAAGAPMEPCAAAMLGERDTLEALIAADPAVADARGPHGIGIVAHAVAGGQTDLARWLAEQGADVNAGAGSTTALHLAAARGDADLAVWLLDRGADRGAARYDGKTAREVAAAAGHTDLAAQLA